MEEKVIFRIEKDPYMPNVDKFLAIFPEDEANRGHICAVPFYMKGEHWYFEPYGEISYRYMYRCRIIHKRNPIVPILVAVLEERYGGTYKVVEKII